MARRTRSVRTRIVLLLVPPIAALVVLWVYAAATTLGDSLRQTRAQTFTDKVVKPTDAMIAALQDERRMSLSYLGDASTIGRSGFEAQRTRTDQTRAAFRRAAADSSVRGAATPETRSRMVDLAESLGEVEGIRRAIDQGLIDRAETLGRYTAFIDRAAEIYEEPRSDDERIVRDTRLLIALERARENLSREDALVTGALAARRLSKAEYLRLVQFAGARSLLWEDSVRSLSGSDRVRYDAIVASPEFTMFRRLEDRLMETGAVEGRPPVDIGAWHSSTESVNARFADLSSGIRSATASRGAQQADAFLLRLFLAGGVGLLAVVASIAVAVQMGRRLITESREMAETVTAFTRDRLPVIGELARRGETLPPEPALPAAHAVPALPPAAQDRATGAGAGPMPVGPTPAGTAHAGPTPARADGTGDGGVEFTVTEIKRIDEAFAEARRAVLRASAGEAEAHQRLNDVFVTLARRNQSLLQRLLGRLEAMERGTEDPDALAALFELDHLATRMRRHAEGLVILSGRPSGRSWRHPVRLMDVARAAASETEDYTRVEVLPMGRAALSGRAVADTIHLLAELVENAAAFSPPNTRIRVTGGEVAHGFAIEVEDRGLGLAREEIVRLNELLSADREPKLDEPVQLGLFVVARLAARHGMRVSLRSSAYGGVVAIVLIPHALVDAGPEGAGGSGEYRPLVAVSRAAAEPAVRPAPEQPRLTPRYASTPPLAVPPPRREEDPVADEPTGPQAGPEPVIGADGLPRRRRQANLAPQLRQAPPAAPGEEEPSERSPEAARSMLSRMQSGWQRGREAAAGPAGPARPAGPGAPETPPAGPGGE
ncbi:nitrate- and nitrite sensing domain-containing protein [Actinomadura graeca]|uniref:histidine kinase n=1 Tax=Actinomadura graeca TaxID=2750812 RepID=A0ABX8QQ00_9ACTN|nr:nitrate- and nitrite sensing domain-containing protein [Actinomadura graeca]QXJ20878.1 nitrate- and nitrite sensing domain-containing protein [Actinomadura graeca]